MEAPNPLLVILGPTASGKTRLAVRLAHALEGEIISADSRQIFKGMDIGTGKDINEYCINGKNIPYHLIDIKEAGDKYNVNQFKEDFYKVYQQIGKRPVLPILCGGSGMYIHHILQNYEYTSVPVNEELRDSLSEMSIEMLADLLRTYSEDHTKHADHSSRKRMIRAVEIAEYLKYHTLTAKEKILIDPFVIGLNPDVGSRRSKVIKRLDDRFKEGLVEEVKELLDKGVSKEILTFYGLEYKFITAYLFNEIDFKSLKEKLAIAICQFAKRQMTFFRKMEKDGIKIHWINDLEDEEKVFDSALTLYQKER